MNHNYIFFFSFFTFLFADVSLHAEYVKSPQMPDITDAILRWAEGETLDAWNMPKSTTNGPWFPHNTAQHTTTGSSTFTDKDGLDMLKAELTNHDFVEGSFTRWNNNRKNIERLSNEKSLTVSTEIIASESEINDPDEQGTAVLFTEHTETNPTIIIGENCKKRVGQVLNILREERDKHTKIFEQIFAHEDKRRQRFKDFPQNTTLSDLTQETLFSLDATIKGLLSRLNATPHELPWEQLQQQVTALIADQNTVQLLKFIGDPFVIIAIEVIENIKKQNFSTDNKNDVELFQSIVSMLSSLRMHHMINVASQLREKYPQDVQQAIQRLKKQINENDLAPEAAQNASLSVYNQIADACFSSKRPIDAEDVIVRQPESEIHIDRFSDLLRTPLGQKFLRGAFKQRYGTTYEEYIANKREKESKRLAVLHAIQAAVINGNRPDECDGDLALDAHTTYRKTDYSNQQSTITTKTYVPEDRIPVALIKQLQARQSQEKQKR